ncbi:protein NRT1/ PTR FAMILY 8.3 [Trifolium repens]|nr:protein NRT1/ PTR FAMILY 8.3 [Trifolium repens]
MCQIVAASFRKRNLAVPEDSCLLYETPDKSSTIEGSRKLEHGDELRCLDRAAVVSDAERKSGDYSNLWRL